MSYWWDDDPSERFWVEIRYALGTGEFLRCPVTPNPWYDLVGAVLPGDTIYHWHAREHRFVGRSQVASPPRVDAGTRRVELNGFTAIQSRVDLETIRKNAPAIV